MARDTARDTSETFWQRNEVPSMCLTESCVLGIDEAGRGAALGPMTYGAAFWADSVNNEMCALNFDDSKAMSAEKREGLFKRLKATPQIGWMVKLISSKEIAQKMLRRSPISLNAISHDCAMELVSQALKDGVQVTKVIVDTVGDPVSYQRKLMAAFDNRIEFIVEKKADANHRPVSAASICAKVLRDKAMETWAWSEPGQDDRSTHWGSGYPSDPKTVEWMKKNTDRVFGFPNIIRFSWAPVKTLLKDSAEVADVEWSDDEDDDENAIASQGTAKLTTFFSAAPVASKAGARDDSRPMKRARLAPFRERNLSLVEDF
jgi:ribonuclease H2 subunit A